LFPDFLFSFFEVATKLSQQKAQRDRSDAKACRRDICVGRMKHHTKNETHKAQNKHYVAAVIIPNLAIVHRVLLVVDTNAGFTMPLIIDIRQYRAAINSSQQKIPLLQDFLGVISS
jgi:hypothetical protein